MIYWSWSEARSLTTGRVGAISSIRICCNATWTIMWLGGATGAIGSGHSSGSNCGSVSSSIERVKGPRWPWLWGSSPLTARMQAGVGFNLLGAAFNQGSTLIVNLAVANLLGTEAFGQYTMVLATIAAVATLGQLSMGYTATK